MIENTLTLSSLMALGAHKYLRESTDPILLLKTDEDPIQTSTPEVGYPLVDTSQLVDRGDRVTSFIEPDSLLLPLRKTTRNNIINRITVGRSGDNDIIVSDKTVSKKHGWFFPPNKKCQFWRFADNGSTNGSSINLNGVSPKVSMNIVSGDEIHLGNVKIMFLHPEDAYSLCKYVEVEWDRAFRLGLPKTVHADTIRLHGYTTPNCSLQKISL